MKLAKMKKKLEAGKCLSPDTQLALVAAYETLATEVNSTDCAIYPDEILKQAQENV